MDDLDKIMETFHDLIQEDLKALADENGDLEIKTGELGLIIISTATALAYKMGSTPDNIERVQQQCLRMVNDLEHAEADKKPKIIC